MNHLKIMLDHFTSFISVQTFERVQHIKKDIISLISNGNFINDSAVLEDNDLEVVNKTCGNQFNELLFHEESVPEEYLKSISLARSLLEKEFNDEQITLKRTNYDLNNKIESSGYYLYKIIHWSDGEEFKEVEVIRSTENGYIPKKVSISRTKTKKSMYLGPMDIAYYKFYAPKYFLKNSFLLLSLLKVEEIVYRQILHEYEYLKGIDVISVESSSNNSDASLEGIEEVEEQLLYLLKNKKEYKELYTYNFTFVLDQIEKGQKLWKKRHELFFDYFIAVHHIENIAAIESYLEEFIKEEKQGITNAGQESKQEFLFDELHHIYTYKDLNKYLKDISNNFYESYQSINNEIKRVYKTLDVF